MRSAACVCPMRALRLAGPWVHLVQSPISHQQLFTPIHEHPLALTVSYSSHLRGVLRSLVACPFAFHDV